MSAKLPRVSASELLRALRRDGWYRHHQTGSHMALLHPAKAGRVVIPIHAGRTIKLKTLQGILDDAGLTAEDLRTLL